MGPPPRRPWQSYSEIQHRPWTSDTEPQRPGFNLKAIFIRLDKNQDQQLSFEEFSQGMKRLFGAFLPGRGPQWVRPAGFAERKPIGPPAYLAMANYPAPGPWINREKIIERFKSLDKNQDRKLSNDEAPPWIQKNFERIDVDKDKLISPREVYRAIINQRQKTEAQKPQKENTKETAPVEKAAEKTADKD